MRLYIICQYDTPAKFIFGLEYQNSRKNRQQITQRRLSPLTFPLQLCGATLHLPTVSWSTRRIYSFTLLTLFIFFAPCIHSPIPSSNTMAMEFLSLSSEETRCLEEERIILGAPQNGKRKMSAALLSPPSSHGSQSSTSGSSSASIYYRAFDAAEMAPFDLPESVESVATYE